MKNLTKLFLTLFAISFAGFAYAGDDKKCEKECKDCKECCKDSSCDKCKAEKKCHDEPKK